MKLRFAATITLLLFVLRPVMAQNLDIEDESRFDIQLSFGAGSIRYPEFTINELRQSLPGSVLLKDSSFSQSNFFPENYNSFSSFNATLGFRREQPEWLNPSHSLFWQVGIGFNTINWINMSMYRETRQRADTIFDSNGDVIRYRDTVSYDSQSLSLESDRISVNGVMMLRLNERKRWSFFTGIALSAGLTFNNQLYIGNYSSTGIIEYDPGSNQTFEYNSINLSSSREENYRFDPSWSVSGYIPLGIDFRLSRYQQNSLIHLFVEGRVGLTHVDFREVRSITGGFFNGNLGIRATL